ncbi:MAG: hypothetical protein KC591_14150 [Gemmatimonadetes bacterium]|nr:hypothetical protein [Gemmatimonadota bacterium]
MRVGARVPVERCHRTGEAWTWLTFGDEKLAKRIASFRLTSLRARGAFLPAIEFLERDARGELATAKILGVPWIPRPRARSTVGRVGGLLVRTTGRDTARLLAHASDRDDEAIILAHERRERGGGRAHYVIAIRGWSFAGDVRTKGEQLERGWTALDAEHLYPIERLTMAAGA